METNRKKDFKKWDDLKEVLVFDFYGEPKEFQTVVEKGFARVIVLANKENKLSCTAMLLKPEDEKMWEYRLKFYGTNTELVKYVRPHTETEENKIEFNKISRALANEMVSLFENEECGKGIEEFKDLVSIPFSVDKAEFWILKYENLYKTTKASWYCKRCKDGMKLTCDCKLKSDEYVLIDIYEKILFASEQHWKKQKHISVDDDSPPF